MPSAEGSTNAEKNSNTRGKEVRVMSENEQTPRRRRTQIYAEQYQGSLKQETPRVLPEQMVPVSPPNGRGMPQQPMRPPLTNLGASQPMTPAYPPAQPIFRQSTGPWNAPMYPQGQGIPIGYAGQNLGEQPPYPNQPVPQPMGTTQPMGMPQPMGTTQPMGAVPPGTNPQPGNPQPYAGWQRSTYPVGMNGGQPPRGPEENGFRAPREPRKPRFDSRKLLLGLLLAIAVILGITAAVNALRSQREAQERQAMIDSVTAYDEKYCEGVYVDGVHLGGMTKGQAELAVLDKVYAQRDAWKVRLMRDGMLAFEITADDLNMTVDVEEALNDAWQQGHVGDVEQRRADMDALLETPYEGYTAEPSGDNAAIDEILKTIQKANREAQDAYISAFDPSAPVPLYVVQEQKGLKFDVEKLRTQLYQMASTLESGEIVLEPEVLEPNVYASELSGLISQRGMAYTPISTTSTENRNNNIKHALEKINGMVLKPGETFSFNTVVGKRTAENGFYQAIEYAYGNEIMGYGGGVCQVSSTVYEAAVVAGLEIVKREPHSDMVNYTPYGKDATVNMDGKVIDLKFRNNTDHDIYIQADVIRDRKLDKDHQLCRVIFYGESLGSGMSYRLETVTVQTLLAPLEPEIRKDRKGDYVTYVDQQEVTRQARDGCVVESYRVLYQNGLEVSREKLFTDTYKAKSQIIYVGVTERPEGWMPTE